MCDAATRRTGECSSLAEYLSQGSLGYASPGRALVPASRRVPEGLPGAEPIGEQGAACTVGLTESLTAMASINRAKTCASSHGTL